MLREGWAEETYGINYFFEGIFAFGIAQLAETRCNFVGGRRLELTRQCCQVIDVLDGEGEGIVGGSDLLFGHLGLPFGLGRGNLLGFGRGVGLDNSEQRQDGEIVVDQDDVALQA